MKPLNVEAIEALLFIRDSGGRIVRHRGGIWAHPLYVGSGETFSDTVIDSLVNKGYAKYTKHFEGRSGELAYPVEVEAKAI